MFASNAHFRLVRTAYQTLKPRLTYFWSSTKKYCIFLSLPGFSHLPMGICKNFFRGGGAKTILVFQGEDLKCIIVTM